MDKLICDLILILCSTDCIHISFKTQYSWTIQEKSKSNMFEFFYPVQPGVHPLCWCVVAIHYCFVPRNLSHWSCQFISEASLSLIFVLLGKKWQFQWCQSLQSVSGPSVIKFNYELFFNTLCQQHQLLLLQQPFTREIREKCMWHTDCEDQCLSGNLFLHSWKIWKSVAEIQHHSVQTGLKEDDYPPAF